ncbi:MAG TPA: adenylosuccinate lyase [Anaerolineaceae bacterium]
MSEYDGYLSPFSWRYGSKEMRTIWSEKYKRRLWRRIWVALAEVQAHYGLVKPNQLDDLHAHLDDINIHRALEIEAEIHHDLMAELRTFGEQATEGRGILHLGATSMDIEDNADALRLQHALDLVIKSLKSLILLFTVRIDEWADIPIMAFTHLQPAEPTTLGYRMMLYAQDLFIDWQQLTSLRAEIKGKGFKGAVGTGASYAELLGSDLVDDFENKLSTALGLPFFPLASQTYPRKQDYLVVSALASLGASLYKFAFDLRLLQSPVIGEAREPFGTKQVGSSAMPFKRNPIRAEKMDSLARLLAQYPAVAWNNAAHSLLERTLDDSANRRSILPESFLIVDELLHTAITIIKGINIDLAGIKRNLDTYAPFAASERLLMALVKAGADRQEMHEKIRTHAMTAWQAITQGKPNPLPGLLSNDLDVQQYLPVNEILDILQIEGYTGFAARRSKEFALQVNQALEKD